MARFFAKAISVTVLGTLALAALAEAARDQGAEVPNKLPFEGTETLVGTVAKVDVSIILRTWRVKGVMVCMVGPEPYACLRVENAWPNGLLEVVRQPFRTHYAELSALFGALEPLRLFGTTSSHTSVAGDGTANQFAEARVYTFLPPVPGLDESDIPIAKPPGPPFQVDYLSELDGFAWRNPALDFLTAPDARIAAVKSCDRMPDLANCAGTWGSYWPRVGFVNHPSPVIASFLQGLRAGRAASRPIGRVFLGPYPFEPRTGHYIQMLRPVPRSPVPIGSPLTKPLETGANSRHGSYLFMHYGIFEVCKRCLPVLLTPPRAPW